jgi:hypothetical protein
MARAQRPSGFAASTKVVVDAVQTTFGAAVVVLFFFGVALVTIAGGMGNLSPEVRGQLLQLLILVMVAVLASLVVLRIVKPAGLAGPPQPETKDVRISNSKAN